MNTIQDLITQFSQLTQDILAEFPVIDKRTNEKEWIDFGIELDGDIGLKSSCVSFTE